MAGISASPFECARFAASGAHVRPLFMEVLQLERLVDDPEIRRATAKTLKGFCLTYLPTFPADLSDFFDEMAGALQDHDARRLEIIGFHGLDRARPLGRAGAPRPLTLSSSCVLIQA
jgi:hypothetical protein